MQKFIKVTPETRAEILKEIAVREQTLYNALNFVTSGFTAEFQRHTAYGIGGVLYVQAETHAEGGCNE